MSNLPDELLEDALRTYPLAEVPPGFSRNVLEKIKPPRPNAALKFRLTWLDYALGLFLSLLPALALVLFGFIPRQFLLRLEYRWLLINSPAFEPYLMAGMLAGVLLIGLSLLLGARWLTRPNFSRVF